MDNFEQPLNIPASSDEIVNENVKFVNDIQFSNADDDIFVALFVTYESDEHPKKALDLIVPQLNGISMDINEIQPSNTLSLIVFN